MPKVLKSGYGWGFRSVVLQADCQRTADKPEITSVDTVLEEGVFSWQRSAFLHDEKTSLPLYLPVYTHKNSRNA